MIALLPPRRQVLSMAILATLVACAALLPGIAGAQKPYDVPAPPADAEGLQRRSSSSVDEFLLRPGASFSVYRRVLLAPLDVSFARFWARAHPDVDARESLRIRTDLAALAREEFVRQLQSKGGYPVVDAPGPDVLEVRASIINLDVRAPDVNGGPNMRSYVLTAGEGTLVAELRDSQTGTLLARVVDRRETREYPDLIIANRVTNSAEARDLVSRWSRLLRRYLDTARTESK